MLELAVGVVYAWLRTRYEKWPAENVSDCKRIDGNTYMEVIGGKADLVEHAFFFKTSSLQQGLKNSLVISTVQVSSVAPAELLQTTLLNLCTLGASKSIDALVHSDIICMHLAYKLEGHSCVVRQVLCDEGSVRTTVVASLVAIRGIERLTEVTQNLSATTIRLVLAVLDNGS